MQSKLKILGTYTFRALLILGLCYGGLYYTITSIKDGDHTKLFNSAFQKALKPYQPDMPGKKTVKDFFAQARNHSQGFAQYLYDNRNNIPSEDSEKNQWMRRVITNHFFSEEQLKQVIDLVIEEHRSTVVRLSNELALQAKQEHDLKLTHIVSLQTGSINQKFSHMVDGQLSSTKKEAQNFWIANVGGGLIVDAVVGKISSSVFGAIGEGMGGDSGRQVGEWGGFIIGLTASYLYSEYQEDRAVKRIKRDADQWLSKVEKTIEQDVLKKLEAQTIKQAQIWYCEVLDALLHQRLWFLANLRPLVLTYNHEVEASA